MSTCPGRATPTRSGAAGAVLLALLFAPAGACDLLADPDFATLGSEEPPWEASGASRAVREGDSARLSRDGEGYALLWQDLPIEQCPAGTVLRASATVRWAGSEDGRGAWCSLHFYDQLGQRIGTAASGVAMEVGKPIEVRVATRVPDRTARAAFVFVVSGPGEALLSQPAVSAAPAPAPVAHPASGVECKLGPEASPREWHGFGLTTKLTDGLGDPVGSARLAFLRLVVPWPDLGVAGGGAGALAERIERAVGPGGTLLWLALGEAEPRFIADPERAAHAAALLAETLGNRAAVAWVSPAAEPDTRPGANPARVAGCLAALKATLPKGVIAAGPDELRGTEWVTAARPALEGLDGPVSAHLELDRRDLALAEERISELTGAGVTALIPSITSQDPHDTDYAASSERLLDTLCLGLAAAAKGVRWIAVEPEPLMWVPVVAALASATPTGGRVHVVSMDPPGRIAAIWVGVGEETQWALIVVNPRQESVSLSARCPMPARIRTAHRIALHAQDGFAPHHDLVPVHADQLADLVPGLAVVVYTDVPPEGG